MTPPLLMDIMELMDGVMRNFKLSGIFSEKATIPAGRVILKSGRSKRMSKLTTKYASAKQPSALLMNNFVQWTEDF